MVTPARISRNRIDRLLQFWVAVGALAGFVAFGATAASAFGGRAWAQGVLCALVAAPCALIVVLNIIVEATGHALAWLRVIGTVLALPLLLMPAGRRWVERLSLRGNASGAWAGDRPAASEISRAVPAGPALYPRARYTLPEHVNGRLVAVRDRGRWY